MSDDLRPKPRRRADLDPLHRAVSDTLDEVDVRLHGNLISSWAYPDEFLEWLAESGYSVVSTAELETARAKLVQLREYTIHRRGCLFWVRRPCDCGLDALDSPKDVTNVH